MSVPDSVDLLEALPLAIYITDAEGRITYYNTAAADLWGHRPELGSRWCGSWRLYWPDGRPLPHDQCPMAITLKEGRPIRDVEAVAERPDGTRVSFLPFPTPLRDKAGRLAGAINLLMDVTERNRAHVESARLAAIVSSSDDAIISKTLTGVITSWNAGATQIFGYQPEEMIGQHITKIIPPELLGEETQILAKLRKGERIDHFETVRVGKDGRSVDISLTVSPIRDAAGSVVGVSKVARDISERRRAENAKRLLMEELNHRVRNTLAVVQSIANQTLARSAQPSAFVSGFTARIQALARTHTLLMESNWQGAEISELVHDQLYLDGGDERIAISGPALRLPPQAALHLALVLHELATNARKYGSLSVPQGSLEVDWTVRVGDGRHLVMKWKESGGPRVRAPVERGFGTSLIERSLQADGGSSSVNYGADGIACEFIVPLAESVEAYNIPPKSAPAVRSSGSAAKASLRGKRILVIEDEPIVAMDLAATLEDLGFNVVGQVGTLKGAMDAIERTPMDGAVLDANLGGEPVDDLAAALVRLNVPFAFITGYGREGLPSAFRGVKVIPKPFGPEQLQQALGSLFHPGADVIHLRTPST